MGSHLYAESKGVEFLEAGSRVVVAKGRGGGGSKTAAMLVKGHKVSVTQHEMAWRSVQQYGYS